MTDHRGAWRWTAEEDAILTREYPTGGTGVCKRLLPNRTINTIMARAFALNIKRIGKGERPNTLPSDDPPPSEMDSELAAQRAFQELDRQAHEAIKARDAAWRVLAQFRSARAAPDMRPRRVA